MHSYLYGVPILSSEEHAREIGSETNQNLVEALAKRHSSDQWIIGLVADRKMVEKQLSDEQKNMPEKQRLTISKVFTPDDLVQ